MRQWICGVDFCLCVQSTDECGCLAVHTEQTGRCAWCGRPMVEIDMETGETVVYAAAAAADTTMRHRPPR